MKEDGVKIWVSSYRGLDKGALRAFADVTISMNGNEITVRGFRVIHKDLVNSEAWVGFPQIRFEKDGRPTYRDLIEVSKEMRREIMKVILDEYKGQMEKVPF